MEIFFLERSIRMIQTLAARVALVWVTGGCGIFDSPAQPTLMWDPDFQPVLTVLGGQIQRTAVQPDGHMIIGGSFAAINGVARGNVARLSPLGVVDPKFVPELPGFGSVSSLILQSDGKLLVGGPNYCADCTALIRLGSDGRRDREFIAAFPQGADVTALALQSDGRIIAAVGGPFGYISGNRYFNGGRIFRLYANGSIDRTFTPAVVNQGDPPRGLIVQADGRIVVYGCGTEVVGAKGRGLIRLNSDGSVDRTFQQPLRSRYSNIDLCMYYVKLLEDGRLYAFGSIQGGDVFRLMADGSVDRTFTLPVKPAPPEISLPNGTEFAVNSSPSGFFRLGPDGSLYKAFTVPEIAAPLTALKDGRFLTLGESLLNVYRPDGTRDDSFSTSRVQVAAEVDAMLAQPDKKLIVIGNFTEVGGVPRPGIARLLATGELDRSFVPGESVPRFGRVWYGRMPVLLRAGAREGEIFAAGFNPQVAVGVRTPLLLRVNTDGNRDPSFAPPSETDGNGSPTLDWPMRDMAVQADGKVILLSSGITEEAQLLRLLPNGSRDPGYNPPRLPFSPQRIVLQPDGRLLVGGLQENTSALARLDEDGRIDAMFSPKVSLPAWGFGGAAETVEILLQSDDKIIFGYLPSLWRFHADGTWDRSFGDAESSTRIADDGGGGNKVVLIGDRIAAFGKITQVNGNNVKTDGAPVNVVWFDRDGQYDSTTAIEDPLLFREDYSKFGAIAPMLDGTIAIAGGNPRSLNNNPLGLGRLRPAPVLRSSSMGADGNLNFTIGGELTWNYQVEAAQDLVTWSVIREQRSTGLTTVVTNLSGRAPLKGFFRVSLKSD